MNRLFLPRLLPALLAAALLAACVQTPPAQSLSAQASSSPSTGPDTAPTLAAQQERERYVSELMQRMTLQEKIGQLRLRSVDAGPNVDKEALLQEIRSGQVGAIFNTVTRPGMRVLQDAAMQSRLKVPLFFAYDVIHGHRTVFPIGLGLASSFDMDAIARSGRISAIEANADGLNMTFAPMVDISRDPRWGRNSEGYGEDTYLTSRIGATLVKALQGDDPSQPGTIMAAVKHFAMYGAIEGARDYNTVDMSPQRMYQDYLPPYKAAIDAGAAGVMVALNAVNGVPATADPWLLQELLRKQWGFKGITVSDHGAILELIRHGVAADGRDAARLAIKAGTDLSMNDKVYGKDLEPLVESGEVSMAEIDEAVRHVLRVKYDLGLFRDAYRHIGRAEDDPADTEAESRLHRADAREVARRSLVLLKNEGDTLPLKKQGTIAVIGPLAKSQRDVMGNWSAAGKARQAVSVYQGLAEATAGRATLLYAKGANVIDDAEVVTYLNEFEKDVEVDSRTAEAMIAEAVQAARKADVVLAVVGESQGMAHEASSRTDIVIPESQRRLLHALKATGKPLVIVLMNGRPLALEWEHANADAMLETWFAGTEGGHAIADVLFGDYNPSGKLPMTFPRVVGQVPLYYNHLNTGRPFDPENPNKYTSRYFDHENGPLYPFGYGLSYTTFDVSDVKLSRAEMARGGQLTASATIRNTGRRDGETVVQLYVQDPVASISRPVRELKGFSKIFLKAGESREVSFEIGDEQLGFYNAQGRFNVEPGKFNVFLGLDSRAAQSASFTLH
ncbi:beta-glucosidase BglX [Bordetella genomosp. 13]|uniref:Periplasmic beta-glucosidase n=1 Tax=Bordetella genomosp. 13 TaxID=463040 RepID=A0A1W6Z810_9BORD|nr:beta-glucosidase BglX [Bordetella genomosp. 13]ARP93375.1 beta-glucosidase [Bordetella genomosp. 13]